MVKFDTEGLILLGLVLLQNNFGVGAYFSISLYCTILYILTFSEKT